VGNIKAHYDISNRMFASFLSADVSRRGGGWPGAGASSLTFDRFVVGLGVDDLLVCHLS
jgi:hypothetical protein